MPWYQTLRGTKRLNLETRQMKRYAPSFFLYKEDETGDLLWRGRISVRHHQHRDVRLVYDRDHPYEEMKVFVLNEKLPCDNWHIHSDGSICYIKSNEWHPEWTALTVYLTVLRFLDDFYSGGME